MSISKPSIMRLLNKRKHTKVKPLFWKLFYFSISVPGLLGDIGGQMGLFIGASILTILELFDYVYEVIKVKMNQKLYILVHDLLTITYGP